jgi:hypothetical protein
MATLALQLPQGVQLQLTLSGAQRQHLQPAQLLFVRMDCRWIHVMPVRH